MTIAPPFTEIRAIETGWRLSWSLWKSLGILGKVMNISVADR